MGGLTAFGRHRRGPAQVSVHTQVAVWSVVLLGFVGCIGSSGDAPAGDAQGRSWGALCQSTLQSPIDIDPKDVVHGATQVRLEYGLLRRSDVQSARPQDGGGPTRIRFNSSLKLGKLQVGTSFTNFDEYALSAIEVHTPSEHTFRHASWPVEIQFWHEPISLLQIPDLSAQVTDLSLKMNHSGAKVSRLVKTSQRLMGELVGEESPWMEAPSWRSSNIQALDWIDSTKRHIAEEAMRFKADTSDAVKSTENIIKEAKRLVDAQGRRYSAHQVVISIFVLRTPYYVEEPERAGLPEADISDGSGLLRWISGVLASDPTGGHDGLPELDVLPFFGLGASSYQDLYLYDGSLTRPPCTSNVRWFVTSVPLHARASDLERFLEVANVGISPVGALFGGRDVQPLGPRKLHRARLKASAFERPALALPEMASDGALKWAFVQRYGKVFFTCASMLLVSPLMFFFARTCLARLEDDKDELSRMESEHCLNKDDVRSVPKIRVDSLEEPRVDHSESWQVCVGRMGSTQANDRAAGLLQA